MKILFVRNVLLALALVMAVPSILASAQDAPTVFAPGIISGPAHDASPAFGPDGRTVYFSRSNPADSTILVSSLGADSRWERPTVAPFSGTWTDMEPAMAPDGSFLIFISNRPASKDGPPVEAFYNGKKQSGGHLWRVDRQGDHWSEPVHLPAHINRSGSIFAPSVVRDGSVYFMEAVGEQHRFRLFRSQWKDGEYQEARPLPFSDGSKTDVDPAVAPDESFAVFSSKRKPAEGMDLFIVFKDAASTWQTPKRLEAIINSPGSDAEARLSPDLKTLFFSSDRVMPIHHPRPSETAQADLQRIADWDDGNYNIWQTPLAPLLEAEASLAFPSQSSATQTSAAPIPGFDVRRLRTGQFDYLDFKQGAEVGSSRIIIQRLPDSPDYRFAAQARLVGDAGGFQDQHWESVATADLAPVSATLSFGKFPEGIPAFGLKYDAGGVTGFVVSRGQSGPGARRTVNEPVPPGTIDQRIDWAAVLASPLAAGWHREFTVYDPSTGVSQVSVEVGGLEDVQVPAGSFRCHRVVYHVKKAGGVETYQILASQDEPRIMVREEFPNGVAVVLSALAETPGKP